MGLPRKLKQFNFFVDGTSYIGETTEVTLPKLAMKLEDYRSGGMQGDVAVNMGIEKLELEFKLGGHEPNLIGLFGGTIDSSTLRFQGGYQREDTEDVDAVEIVCRGRVSEIEFGNAKAGDDTEHSYKVVLTYYKLSTNGKTDVEIDMLNHIFMVNGKDRMATIRQAIGL